MFYLITTAVSFIGMKAAVKAIEKKVDEDGYCFKSKNKSKEEKRLDNMKTLFVLLCPGLNIIFTSVVVFGFDKIYESFKKDSIRNGTLIKKEEIKPEEQKDKEVDVDLQTNEINRTRKYSELTSEEKLSFLEDEKRRLLKQQEASTEKTNGSYYDRGAYVKRK